MRTTHDARCLPSFDEIVGQLNDVQMAALLTDEAAIEALPFRLRDEMICLGLVRRAWPQYTANRTWRSWLTPLGTATRTWLCPEHYSASVDAGGRETP